MKYRLLPLLSILLASSIIAPLCTASPSAAPKDFAPQTTLLSYKAKQTQESTIHQKASAGKIIAYLPGWIDQKSLPSATALRAAGYTHVLVAFGVFSTSRPGEIVSAFSSVTPDYINALHQAGLKISLSLGGASTSIPETSVSFHEALQAAGDAKKFESTFVASVKKIISDNHFDGIDIDIEHGLSGLPGTFAKPEGDVLVMANILNQLHADLPELLISMAPQAANVAATAGFDDTWGNYASLIMQTHEAISWVGVQNYNTGCVFGIDHICYANEGKNADFSVAIATDLLENWPQKDSTGRATGFQPYVSDLRPDQIVLGYPAPNKQGASDGAPATPTPIIKQAIQCLKTGTVEDCGASGYRAPKSYSTIGGVFEWEVTYDQNNNFRFANDLKACVVDGSCK